MIMVTIMKISKVCENNWVRRIAGVKRIDKERMEELREEVGVKEGFRRKLVRNRLKWTGHVENGAGTVGEENGCA